jgi:hypothetical protein
MSLFFQFSHALFGFPHGLAISRHGGLGPSQILQNYLLGLHVRLAQFGHGGCNRMRNIQDKVGIGVQQIARLLLVISYGV